MAGRARDGSASADYGKTASFLAVGVGLTGLITYAYFLIASHVLSKPDYGQITVLWSAVFITISTLYRPVEQLLSRHISERLEKRRADRPADAGRLDDPARPRAALRGRRPGPARADPGRPAGRQRNALLGLLRRGPLLRRQLLRPRLPRRPAPLRPVHGADPLRVVLPHARSRSWSRSACSAASRRSRSASSPRRRSRCWSCRSPSRRRAKKEAAAPAPARRCESEGEHEDFSMRKGGGFAGGRAGDHVQRTGLPQRRAADHPRPAGRRGGRVHLQRADDRAGAAAALPGGLDQHPAPPDQPPHLDRPRQRARIPPHGADGPARASPPSPPRRRSSS